MVGPTTASQTERAQRVDREGTESGKTVDGEGTAGGLRTQSFASTLCSVLEKPRGDSREAQ